MTFVSPDNVGTFDQACALRDKATDNSVVLATGCFDILHVGHVYFLEQAADQGDLLIVGVNSDRSVRAMKGPTRPITNELERASLIAALRCVDYVFVYDDVVADSCIRTMRPDTFVIGAESVGAYPSEVAATQDCGGRVHVVDRLPTHSTTSVVERVQGGASL